MATSNFKLFDENKSNMMSDEEYSANTQRVNGVQTGIASSTLQNKAQYQTSLIAYSIAQLMLANGIDANDTAAVNTFVNNLSSSLVQKIADLATQAEAVSGTIDNKWMSPLKVKQFLDSMKATQEEAIAGTNDIHFMTPAKTNLLTNLDYIFSIGDTITTARNKISDKWLICNGAVIDKTTYPLLNDVVGINIPISLTSSSFSSTVSYSDVAFNGKKLNGYYVFCSATSGIWYSSTPQGPYTFVSIGHNARDIIYVQGYYYVVCWDSWYSYVGYSTNIAGPYTFTSIGSYNTDYLSSVAYSSTIGKIVIASGETSSILYTSSPTQTPTKVTLSGSAGQNPVVSSAGNYFFYGGGSSSIYYSSDGVTWNAMSGRYGTFLGAYYYDGYYYCVESGSNTIYIRKGNPTGTWSLKTFALEGATGGDYFDTFYAYNDICFFYKYGYLPVFKIRFDTDTAISVSIASPVSDSPSLNGGVLFSDDYFVKLYRSNSSSSPYTRYVKYGNTNILPSISIGNCNTFIKASN